MQPNGLVNLLVDLPPALNIVRRKPAAHALRLKVGIEPVGKVLVVCRIADEAHTAVRPRRVLHSVAPLD